MLNKTFQFYDAERVGVLPPDFRIPWRGDSLVYEIGPQSLGFGNVTGGWMGGGNSGTVKNTIPTAMSVAMIAWGLLEFPIVRPYLSHGMQCLRQGNKSKLSTNQHGTPPHRPA